MQLWELQSMGIACWIPKAQPCCRRLGY